MKSPVSTFLFAFVCVAASPMAAATSSQQEIESGAEEASGHRYPLNLQHEYRLSLHNADDFKLKELPEYRLNAPWRRPEPAPERAVEPEPVLPPIALPFHAEVLAAAHESGVEPALIHAVIRVESAYNPQAVSPKGAVGLMQLMPDTAKRYGVRKITHPADNVRGGAQYLSELSRLFDGNLTLVLAAYNAGENAVLRYGRAVPKYPETLQYIPRVLAEYERLRNFAIVVISSNLAR